MRALPVAAAMVVGFTASAAAQMPAPGTGYYPGGSGGAPNVHTAQAPVPGERTTEPPCFGEFNPIRHEAQAHLEVLKAAMQKKAPREEACKLIKAFSAAEAKVVDYVTANQESCGIPQQGVDGMKKNHERTVKMEAQVCNAANEGPGLQDPQPRRLYIKGLDIMANPNEAGSASSWRQ
jgi:hypothetical protein